MIIIIRTFSQKILNVLFYELLYVHLWHVLYDNHGTKSVVLTEINLMHIYTFTLSEWFVKFKLLLPCCRI